VCAVKAEADRYAANVLPIIREAHKAGARTLREIAEARTPEASQRRGVGNGMPRVSRTFLRELRRHHEHHRITLGHFRLPCSSAVATGVAQGLGGTTARRHAPHAFWGPGSMPPTVPGALARAGFQI